SLKTYRTLSRTRIGIPHAPHDRTSPNGTSFTTSSYVSLRGPIFTLSALATKSGLWFTDTATSIFMTFSLALSSAWRQKKRHDVRVLWNHALYHNIASHNDRGRNVCKQTRDVDGDLSIRERPTAVVVIDDPHGRLQAILKSAPVFKNSRDRDALRHDLLLGVALLVVRLPFRDVLRLRVVPRVAFGRGAGAGDHSTPAIRAQSQPRAIAAIAMATTRKSATTMSSRTTRRLIRSSWPASAAGEGWPCSL